ncbi:uncharacterized protein B0P05DRAFT_542073 [Gilbertella persicaria]|uniref:uncharacterized protein n=1 Tax=Gilbertella persicaria TaxID=101096 RepID=UPI002220B841|nr:uncharacterized protein B0P05DRAFT_542073 [Gilbertella persicaria]KAI8079019.1 hypothetical protein B0P05DRAFT_542073 [Gilbertella persicaria]
MSSSPNTSTKRLYIGNLDETVNEYAIMKLFQPFGKITFIEVMVHWTGIKKGQPRGYCFLEFETKQQASNAINAMHGKVMRGKSLVVSFAHMTPEHDQVKTKRAQISHKPTTISLLKGQKMKNSSTDAKIKAIEAKLALLKQDQQTSSSNHKSPSNTKERYKPY